MKEFSSTSGDDRHCFGGDKEEKKVGEGIRANLLLKGDFIFLSSEKTLA